MIKEMLMPRTGKKSAKEASEKKPAAGHGGSRLEIVKDRVTVVTDRHGIGTRTSRPHALLQQSSPPSMSSVEVIL